MKPLFLSGRFRLLLVLIPLLFGSVLLLAPAASAQLGLAAYEAWSWPENHSPRLGNSVAVGDFDGDGVADMALGAATADVGGSTNSGRVHLRRTLENGTTTWGFRVGCLDDQDRGNEYRLGAALAFGDFDGDGDDDLAVGMPGAPSAGVEAGVVCIVEGGPGPFDGRPATKFSQANLLGASEPGDLFGAVLAAGDLNGDDYDDLAIGSPGESFGSGDDEVDGAGAVHVVFGGPTGLTSTGDVLIRRGVPGVVWSPQEDEGFGSALAIGDFWSSELEDLAVGAPGDNPACVGGSVNIFLGHASSPVDTAQVPYCVGGGFYDLLGSGTAGDGFGSALAGGDFDGDGDIDLAVGIPGESDLGPEVEAGAVMVIYRDGSILSDVSEQILFEPLFGGTVNAFDRFGSVLAAGDFDGDGRSDLAMGAPKDNSLGVIDAGEVTVIYGSDNGLVVAGFQIIDMIFFGTLGQDDEFGSALATGKLFDRGGGDDLLIGVPGRLYDNGAVYWPDTGAAVVVQSVLLFSDGFESGDTSAWAD